MASLGIRQIKTSEELVAVQSRQADMIARANDKAYNLARDSEDALSLAGKTGLDRTRAEIDIKYRDYKDQLSNTTIGDDFGGIGSAFLPAKAAVSDFSSALTDAARRLGAFPGAGGALPASGPYGALQSFSGGASPYAGPLGAVSDHQKRLAQILIDAGYPAAGTYGFVGGLTGESGAGLDPLAKNASGHRGIAQWDSSRFSAMGGAMDFETQAKFILKELASSESVAGSKLRSATSVGDGLAANFAYERPSAAERWSSAPQRLAAGNALAATMGGDDHTAMTIHPALRSPAPLGVRLDTAGKPEEWGRNKDARDNIDAGEGIINSASNALKERAAAFDLLTKSTEMTAKELARYTELSKLQLDLDLKHVQVTPKMTAEMGVVGEQAAKLADDEAKRKSQINTADSIRGATSGSLDTLFTSLARGQSFGKTLSGIGMSIGDKIIGGGVNMLTDGLFGKSGTPGAGLLGGLIPKFAGGTNDAPGGVALVGEKGPELVNLPAGAQVMSNAALGGGMASRAPNVTVGGHQITIQGNADEKTLAAMDVKLAAANQQIIDHVTRNLPQIQADAQQY